MVHRRTEGEASGTDLPFRSVHTAKSDVSPGQARLHSILQLFPMAQREVGTHAVLHGTGAVGRARIFSAQPLAEYAGHIAAISAIWRPARIHCSADAGRNAGRELRHLRAGVRAVRTC